MNVGMIWGLAEQHKALKAFHSRCNQSGVTLTVTRTCPDGQETLQSSTAALIMKEVRRALLKRISETEKAIEECACS